MENKFINRYNTFCKSLKSLEKSCTADPKADFVLEATALNFNLTFDISWKIMKDILVKQLGVLDFSLGSPRGTLQQAFQNGLINDDRWIQMLKDRNRLAYDYDGTFAATRFQVIVDEYYHLFVKLRDSMEKYYQDFDEMNTL